MGCDIHLHIEVKLNGKWEHYAAPSVNRYYVMFERMAGVRGDITNAISIPKGLPEDVTTITRYDADRMGSDGHSHSWLGVDELMKLEDWLKTELRLYNGIYSHPDLEHEILHCYFFGNSFTGIKRYPTDYRGMPEIENVRFVFWFDN
jgi:hypothetical protein